LHWRNLATSAPHTDYLDADRVTIRVELYEHARGDFLRRIRRHALGAECDMEDVGLWIVTGTDHSFAPLSQCERLRAGSVISCTTRSGEVSAASM
jgi:hypothetical protein